MQLNRLLFVFLTFKQSEWFSIVKMGRPSGSVGIVQWISVCLFTFYTEQMVLVKMDWLRLRTGGQKHVRSDWNCSWWCGVRHCSSPVAGRQLIATFIGNSKHTRHADWTLVEKDTLGPCGAQWAPEDADFGKPCTILQSFLFCLGYTHIKLMKSYAWDILQCLW